MASRPVPVVETLEVANLPGGPLRYTLRRSGRSRRMRVVVDPVRGVIVVIPPRGRPGWAGHLARVEMFLAEREPWLRRHLGRQARQRDELATRGGTAEGAMVRFRGELHRLAFETAPAGTRRSSVTREGDLDGDRLVIRLAARDRRDPARVLVDWGRDRAREAIERAVAHHAPALGVAPAALALRDPRTRWGSASHGGRLSFSWRLVLAPAEALDTVVVHELAHLRVFGHGPAFWELVATRRPDHLAWRRWLRLHAFELHHAFESDPGNDGEMSSKEPAADGALG